MVPTTLPRRVMTLAAFFAVAATVTAGPSLTPEETYKAKELVRLLGAKDFKVREGASGQLIRMGSAVEPVLRDGLTATDPEIRFRCRTILPLALTYDLERRLQAFLAGKEDKENPAPASWAKFKELVGDDEKVRQLFATMHRYDTEFLTGLEKNPAGVQQKLAARCMDFMQERNYGGNANVSPERLALLLFASQEPKVKLDPSSQSYFSSALHSLSYQPQAKALMKNNETIRKLLVKYIIGGGQYTASNGLYLVANLELKEGVDIAKNILKASERDPHSRGMAISILGKLGGKDHLADILPFLDDKSPMGETQFGNGNRIKTQLRDVALAALIQMTGQNLLDYNFAYFKMFGGRVNMNNLTLSPSLFGFADDATRDASIKKWRDWHDKNKDSVKK